MRGLLLSLAAVAVAAALAAPVAPAQSSSASSGPCRPLRAVFYTADDWLRLAGALAADASPCAQYFISIPPLAADKTNFRTQQPAQIRALGPQFHVLAEISYNGWSNWVAQTGSTFYDAGVEARRRMAAQGFDVAAGDSWIVNELSSAVRAGTGTAREKIRDLVRGLYDGDGTVPRVQGGIYDIGLGQSTSDLSAYKLNLQGWYGDTGFWQDMRSYVADWEQEVYGDVRDYAVAGATPETRAAYLDDYLQHPLALAAAAPSDAATASSYLQQSYSPLGNAAWAYDSGFGFTNVPLQQMEDFVTAQVYAMRGYDASRGATDRFGFAWAPKMPDGSPWTSQFTTDTGALLQRLAAAIHDSDSGPAAACGASWCTASLDGASFVAGWKTFAAWSYPTLAFSTPPASVAAGTPAQLTVGLTQAGVAQTATSPLAVTFTSSSPTAGFSTSADGPWAPTLDVQVPAGASTASVFFRDTTAGSTAVSAAAAGWQPAAQSETVTASPPVLAPPPGGGGGGGVSPDLAVTLAPGAATVPAAGGELDVTATVSTLNAGSASGSRLVLDLPADYTVARVYTDRGTCTVAAQVICDTAWISPGTSTHVTVFGTVTQPVALRFAATVASTLETELDPSNNSTSVTLAPAQPAVEDTSGGSVALRALKAPRILGSARVGRTLRAGAAVWTRPTHAAYRWQLCRGSTCSTIARGTTLRVRASYVGRRVRVVATAENVRSASRYVYVSR
jgi:Domain of unknown function DUF11